MDALKLSEQEQIYYGELFQICDVEGTGKISGVKASELFLSSGLSQDILLQITDLCGAKRLGHFGRSQFYIALKLIALAQVGLPVKLDILNSGKDVPLPKFSRQNDQEKRFAPVNAIPSQDTSIPDRPSQIIQQSQPPTAAGQLPPPPVTKKSHSRNLSGQHRGLADRDVTTAQQQQPQQQSQQSQPQSSSQTNSRDVSPLNTRSPQFSPSESPASSPPVMVPSQNPMQQAPSIPSAPTAAVIQGSFSPSAQPTVIPATAQTTIQTGPSGGYVNSLNSTHDVGWASFEDEESHGLLGTGPKKTYNLEPPGFDSSSISSDPESVDDIWSINDEQRDYYVKQFMLMQPDVTGSILGGIAKDFFEKSKLPVHELSKIWQLSDLNRDGALNLEEFCIAMHLVVLRRNEIELPERLPFSLMPYSAFTNEEPFAADLPPGSTLKRTTPPLSPPETSQQQGGSHWVQSLIHESPQTLSEKSSPSIKPVNFEFSKPVPSDPEGKIYHPVPVRMSPESHVYMEGKERGRAFSEPVPVVESTSPDQSETPTPMITTKQRSNTESYPENAQNEILPNSKVNPPTSLSIQGRPRPVPKKPNAVPGTVSGLLIPVPVSSQSQTDATDRPPLMAATSLENVISQEPPAPPPRPQFHGRSLSVDLKGLSTPPAVPPRTSPKDGKIARFTEFKRFESIPSQEVLNIIPIDEADDRVLTNGTDQTHRRSLSLDASKMGPSLPEAGDAGTDMGSTNPKVTSPGVSWSDDVDGGEGEKTRLPMFALRQISRDKKDLQMAIRTHKERNSTLERLNSELNQELQEVMEQRIALEIQLEHLKPFSS